jgi:hypothetical protein
MPNAHTSPPANLLGSKALNVPKDGRPTTSRLRCRSLCQGVAGVRRKLAGLQYFQWHSGYQVEKALVIRDSDFGDPRVVTLPVHFYATRCMVEDLAVGG